MGWAERAEAGLRSHSRRRPSWPGGHECSVRQLSLRPLGPSAASVPVSGEQVKLRGRLGVCSWSPGASHPLRGGSGRRSFLALRGHWTKATGFLVTALKLGIKFLTSIYFLYCLKSSKVRCDHKHFFSC